MKARGIISILVLSAAVALTAGCGKKTTTSTNQAPAASVASSAIAGGFSADFVQTSSTGQVMKAHMYTDGKNKVLIETGTPMGNMLVRKDKGTTYMISNSTKSVYPAKMDPEELKKDVVITYDISKLKKIGSEKVDGYQCTKYTETTQWQEKTYWICDDNKLPIREEIKITKSSWREKRNGRDMTMSTSEPVGSTTRIEMKNIKPGKQDDSKFEIPAGYKVVSM